MGKKKTERSVVGDLADKTSNLRYQCLLIYLNMQASGPCDWHLNLVGLQGFFGALLTLPISG